MIKTWLRKNGLWALLNLGAVSIMLRLMTDQPRISPYDNATFSALFEDSGLWAVRFLLLCLSMTPLNTLFNWRGGLKLRKPAGLWAFGFAALHFLTYINFQPALIGERVAQPNPLFIDMGIAALTILLLLALTSNQRAMRWLGKKWKRLHRLVYAAGVLTVLHAIIAFSSSKKAYFEGDSMRHELTVYAAAMAVLLALRLPPVKALIRALKPGRAVRIQWIETYADQSGEVSPKPTTMEVEKDIDLSVVKE